jgi:hypothetical protein
MATDNVELLRLGRRIQAECKIPGFSQNGFAKDCGLNRSHFGGGHEHHDGVRLPKQSNELLDIRRAANGAILFNS